MRELVNRLKSSQLVTVSFFSGIASVVKIMTAFILSKVIAVYLGPEGLGTLGQLTSFVTIALTISTGATANGVIKYVAEYNSQPFVQQSFIKASAIITLVCSVLVSLAILLFSSQWSDYLFKSSTDYKIVFILFGCTLFFYSFYSLFTSILNGLKQYKTFNYIGMVSSVVGLCFTLFLVQYYGILGALISAISYQSVVVICLFFFAPATWKLIRDSIRFAAIKKSCFYELSKFSLMAMVSTVTVPVAQIIIRNYLGTISSETIGYYEGVNRISLIYLGLITSTLSIYYLPRLSELTNKNLLRAEIFKGYKVIMPLVLVLIIAIYVLKDFVISIVFAPTFAPMSDYFLPQLIGDFLKIASWLLAFQMLAKAMTRAFIITEIIFSLSLVALSILFINMFGGIGAVYAYALNYFFYLICMVTIFRKLIFNKHEQ